MKKKHYSKPETVVIDVDIRLMQTSIPVDVDKDKEIGDKDVEDGGGWELN